MIYRFIVTKVTGIFCKMMLLAAACGISSAGRIQGVSITVANVDLLWGPAF